MVDGLLKVDGYSKKKTGKNSAQHLGGFPEKLIF
jgi:hypothetical protein